MGPFQSKLCDVAGRNCMLEYRDIEVVALLNQSNLWCLEQGHGL